MKNSCIEDLKPENFGSYLRSSLTPQYINVKPLNKKKQKWNLNKKNLATSIFGTNAIKSAIDKNCISKKQKQDNQGSKKKNISKITYYNCDKKSYYVNKYLKSPKVKN